ncbi:hypothetical protein [Lunatibacter salilacus]|uniref:hypothetical protein n=1 Tax=Lunatibacter salilacus TaxID=2483804 RepID=UPI00131BD0E9|nr:hypothetical protein [Lunatibacter salilacus]
MIQSRQNIIERIFSFQNGNGLWEVIPESHKYFPDYLHYVPNYKASVWTLILLAELQCRRDDDRVVKPLIEVKNHLYDEEHGIYSLKEDHFPIPCLNGNMLFLDCYFNGGPDDKSKRLLEFFYDYQRFDDGKYEGAKNQFCSNTSCYGKHTCYWGVVKLLKGISFIPESQRSKEVKSLRDKCIDFVLKHKVCYSSHQPSKIMINKIDFLTFPNFYKSDFLEILWILAREKITSMEITSALELLQSKRRSDGTWELEREMNNMVVSIGKINQPNQFITERANEVSSIFSNEI